MALEGTHIRFALDMKDQFQVTDLSKFLSGAIYPDSRYANGIERDLTHPLDYASWPLDGLDDFKKGWRVHLIYDDLQLELLMQDFPEIRSLGIGPQGSEFWIRLTALKSLQDISDMKKTDIKPYLSMLDYIATPNGEKIEGMQRYNRAVQQMYAHEVDIASCVNFWRGLGQPMELSDKIQQRSEEYARNPEILARIEKVYPKTMVLFETRKKLIT